MASHLNPYLIFDGTAREAMSFYESVLGGSLTVNTFGDAGAPEGVDPDALMHAQLETPDGFVLMASDVPPGMPHASGSSMSISLSGDDEASLRRWWGALSDGGTVTVPLEQQMWGDVFGACTDRYGVSWMVNIVGSAA